MIIYLNNWISSQEILNLKNKKLRNQIKNGKMNQSNSIRPIFINSFVKNYCKNFPSSEKLAITLKDSKI